MSELAQNQFFSDFQPLIENKRQKDSKFKHEKLKLHFSILNANKGMYMIHAKLFDKYEKQQVFDYISEVKRNNEKQKIVFEKFFNCNFYFQKEQKFNIVLKKNGNSIKIKTTIGEIVGSNDCTFSKNYLDDEILYIKAEKLGNEDDLVNMNFSLKHNSNKNYFKNNKIYCSITCGENNIYKSAQIQDDGTFQPFIIPIHLLQPSYKVSFYNIKNKFLFAFNKTINDIKSKKQSNKKIPLINGNYIILSDNSEITKNFTFIDYIKSGVKIALSIGIDFTGSNGHPNDFASLHSKNGPNDYERAITACAKIVGKYDDDQLFPVFGFGAIINAPGSTEASMCFNLNFSEDPNIYGLDNIKRAYHECIENDKSTFSGPTEFTPLIKEVISRINKDDPYEYHILMILTDGVIDDLEKTIDVIVEASLIPLSIIIIGIGNADFQKMDILDGDDVPLTSSTGQKRKRDLVQFVPFSKHQNNEEELAMEVLAEIPRQIVEFYQFKNLNPDKIKRLKEKDRSDSNDSSNEINDEEDKDSFIDNKTITEGTIYVNDKRKDSSINDNVNQNTDYQNSLVNKNPNYSKDSSRNNDSRTIQKSISNYDIISTERDSKSKNIPIFHINDSSKKSNGSIKITSTQNYCRSSIDSSTARLINQPNPFYIPKNNNDNNCCNNKINYNYNYNNIKINERYKMNENNFKNNLDNQNQSSLIINGMNVIQSNQNMSINKKNGNNNNNININSNRKSFDRFNLSKNPTYETIKVNKIDLNKKTNNKRNK